MKRELKAENLSGCFIILRRYRTIPYEEGTESKNRLARPDQLDQDTEPFPMKRELKVAIRIQLPLL